MTDLPTSLPCNWARTRQPHPPHDWEPQPGMNPVHCPGNGPTETAEATEPAEAASAPWTQLEARAFNAVQPALREAGEWLPLSARRKVAQAVLAEILGTVEAGTDTATWTAVRAIQLMSEAGQQRDEAQAALARVQRLLDSGPIGTCCDYLLRAALQTEQSKPAPTATEATEPREHCGHLMPAWSLSPRAECTLRPGHQGSHADDRGARWWYDPTGDSSSPCTCGGRFPLQHLHADQHQPEEQP